MNDITFFQILGVDETGRTLYLALLEQGPSSIRNLATTTGINRGKVYESLKQLSSNGLVGIKKAGERRTFVAEKPERLIDLLEDKRHELSQAEETAEKLVPRLSATGKRHVGEPIMRFHEDDEGVVAILRDVLSTAGKLPEKEYYVFSSRPLRQYLYRKFPNFTRRRIKEGISVKVIAIGEGGESTDQAERKWIAEPVGEQLSCYTIIYGDKLAMISLSANRTPYGVVIDEPGVAAAQRLLFEQLWKSL